MFKTFEHTEPLKTGYFDGYSLFSGLILTESYVKQWQELAKRIKKKPYPNFVDSTENMWRFTPLSNLKRKTIKEWKNRIDEDLNEFLYEISLLFVPDDMGMDESKLKGYPPRNDIDGGPEWLREVAFTFFIHMGTGNQRDIWKVISYDISAKLHNIFSLIDDTEQFSGHTKKAMDNLKRYLHDTSAFDWSSGKLKMVSQNGDKWF
jgi:hypothetical protein